MIPLQEPESKYDEDYHRHEFYVEEEKDKRTHVATIEFDDLTDERGGLWCEVTVYSYVGSASSEPIIAFQRTNLLTSMASTVKELDFDGGAVNWKAGLDTAVFRTIHRYRSEASESEWMERRVATSADSPYLLKPFISRTGVTVLFGPRGTGKSTFALRLAYAVASGEGFNGETPTEVGPVMYLDFEDTVLPHEFRLSAMTDGKLDGLIRHVRITKSLKDARRLLRKMVRDDDVSMVVLDSVALARAADVSGSEATIKMFKTLAQLGVPVLAIDHMTKEDNKAVATGSMDWRKASPIGSQFTESSSRLAWFMNLLPQSTGTNKVFNLYNTKNNHGPTAPVTGMNVTIAQGEHEQMESVTFEVSAKGFESLVVEAMKMTKAQELLVWHFKQQRDPDNMKVMPLTLKKMSASGIHPSTLSSIVTSKNAEWWEKIEGSGLYALTPKGLELAMLYSTVFAPSEEDSDE